MNQPKQAPVLSAKRSARDILRLARERAKRLLQDHLLSKDTIRHQSD
ncbi:hypothetical protein [Duganella radicis]|uniref:Uncharacterized protein n=1 Tax=Duganella radicis TaxID=551988 RepID=A0A6L6PML5_9BURK|nr:hypothetical protein [Duganella radicis]MTV40234.1 hypothetical protein [Duganella radicis]